MGSGHSTFAGSSSGDAAFGLPPSSDTPVATIGPSSYFTPAAANLLTHDHPHTAAECAVVEAALLAHLPADIVQCILDLAEVWTCCRRANRRTICVQAGGDEPHGTRGEHWRTGQEDEVSDDGLELVDGPGDVWYLVSRELGCCQTEEVPTPAEFDEDQLDDRDRRVAGVDLIRPLRDLAVVEESEEEDVPPPRSHAGRRLSYVGSKRWWCRRIVVELFSRDQGWVSETSQQYYGTYEHSFSWFELGIVRDGKALATRYRIQNNIVAGAYYKSHTVVLGLEHEMLGELKEGDRVVLWLRADSPGWMNRCRRATITVYAAPFAPH